MRIITDRKYNTDEAAPEEVESILLQEVQEVSWDTKKLEKI
jgi:hypothetical protein